MKKKILTAVILAALGTAVLTGCAGNISANSNAAEIKTQQSEKPKASNEGKDGNIGADSQPIGVDDALAKGE